MQRIVNLLLEAHCLGLQLGGPAIAQEIFPPVQEHDARARQIAAGSPGQRERCLETGSHRVIVSSQRGYEVALKQGSRAEPKTAEKNVS